MKLRQPKVLLALDVGFASCGIVVIDLKDNKILHSRCLHTEKIPKESASVGYARRSREIAHQLDKICADYSVTQVTGELPHGGAKSARAVASMTMAISIVAVFCTMAKLPFYSVTPLQVKRLVRAKGAVEKDEVEVRVIEFFGNFLPNKKAHREHISDAAAAGIVYLKSLAFKIS